MFIYNITIGNGRTKISMERGLESLFLRGVPPDDTSPISLFFLPPNRSEFCQEGNLCILSCYLL